MPALQPARKPALQVGGEACGTSGSGRGADEGAQAGVGEVETVGAGVEVKVVEAGGVAVGYAGKAGGEEFALHHFRAEEEAERLTGGGDSGGEQVEDFATAAGEGVWGECVVEAQAGAGGEMGDGCEGCAEGFEGEVGGDAEPAEEGGAGGVEAGFDEAGGEGFVFEVERDKGEVGGDGDGGLIEHEALPLLGRGEIDLEDVERGERVAVGEGVESCAEDDVLGDAASDGEGELIFSEAAAGGHEATEVLGDGMAGALEIACVAFGDEGKRDGVVEDAGLLHELVSGTADGDAEGGSAGLAVFHEFYRNWRCRRIWRQGCRQYSRLGSRRYSPCWKAAL